MTWEVIISRSAATYFRLLKTLKSRLPSSCPRRREGNEVKFVIWGVLGPFSRRIYPFAAPVDARIKSGHDPLL